MFILRSFLLILAGSAIGYYLAELASIQHPTSERSPPESSSPGPKPSAPPPTNLAASTPSLESTLREIPFAMENSGQHITGSVSDSSGQPLVGVKIRLYAAGSRPGFPSIEVQRNSLAEYIQIQSLRHRYVQQSILNTSSSETGHFSFTNVYFGQYKVEAHHPNFYFQHEILGSSNKTAWPGEHIQIVGAVKKQVTLDVRFADGTQPEQIDLIIDDTEHSWHAGNQTLRLQPGIHSVSTERNFKYSSNQQLFDIQKNAKKQTFTYTIQTKPALEVQFNIQTPLSHETANGQIYWLPAPHPGPPDLEILAQLGRQMEEEFYTNETDSEFIQDVHSGSYWVGLGFDPQHIEVATTVEISDGLSKCDLGTFDFPKELIFVATLPPETPSYKFNFADFPFISTITEINENGQLVLLCSSYAPYNKLKKDSKLKIVFYQSRRHREEATIFSQQFTLNPAKIFEVEVHINIPHGQKGYLTLQIGYRGPSQFTELEGSKSVVLQPILHAGNQRLELYLENSLVYTQQIDFHPGMKPIVVELPQLFTLTVRNDAANGGLFLHRLDSTTDRYYRSDSIEGSSHFINLPAGRYRIFDQSNFMDVAISTDRSIDFAPTLPNAYRVQFSLLIKEETLLQHNDLIIGQDGVLLKSLADLVALEIDINAHSDLTLSILREGQIITLRLPFKTLTTISKLMNFRKLYLLKDRHHFESIPEH